MAEFDLASQQMTREDEILKDIKCNLQPVLKMDSAIGDLSKELQEHIQECGH